jgi:hypothetical protein
MEHLREIKNQLNWHTEAGKFEATIVNGAITDLNFCEPGKGSVDCGKCLTSTDYKFLKQIHTALGELFDFIEAESKRMGHTFAND